MNFPWYLFLDMIDYVDFTVTWRISTVISAWLHAVLFIHRLEVNSVALCCLLNSMALILEAVFFFGHELNHGTRMFGNILE